MRRLLLLFLIAAPTFAQEQLGTVVFPNDGEPEAQAAFLRGVKALHNFWYPVAFDAFREAEAIDPRFVLAYWGEAMTYNHPIWEEVDLESGRKVLKRLHDNPATISPHVSLYVAALDALYGDGDKAERDARYERAMGELAAKYPDDVEAQVFHALAILGTIPREGDPRKSIRAAAILEPILADHPDHPGVLHYLIHAYDDPLHAPLGLRAARRYAEVAPAAHHALHMPSHIFLQLGMWDDAARSNEQAYAASKTWADAKHLPRAERSLHSLQWLQYVYLQQRRFADAKKLLDEIPPAAGETPAERSAREAMQARYAIETGDWTVLGPDASATSASAPAPAPPAASASCAAMPYDRGASPLLFAKGMRDIARQRFDDAGREIDELKRSGEKHKLANVMADELQAQLAFARGKQADAIRMAEEATKLEEAFGPPSGPPDAIKPAHELLGELLLATGDAKRAREQFRTSLERTPNRTASVDGLAKAERALR